MENINKILKYNYDGQDVWIYSVVAEDDELLDRYYSLSLKGDKLVIEDFENPIETLQKINFFITPTKVEVGSDDFLAFIALKKMCEEDIINKLKR